MIEKVSDETYMRTLIRRPAIWVCCKCGRSGENRPDREVPVGMQLEWNSEKQRKEIVGDICKDCMGK